MVEPTVVFLLGLSGAGKSTVADWMAKDFGFIHLDIDPGGLDGIDACDLRKEWTAYGKGNPQPMAAAARARATEAGALGTVLSFPSMVFSRDQIDTGAKVGIVTLVLYGAEELCIRSFLEREKRTGRGFDARRWHKFNDGPLGVYGRAEYEDVRVEAFRRDGSYRSREEMMATIRERLGL